jgi:hypothetical protein
MIRPEILRLAINHDQAINRAVAILTDKWDDIYDDSPFVLKMSIQDVRLAQEILKSGIVTPNISFDDYNSMHKFVVKNSKYMDSTAKRALLLQFQ